MKYVIIFRVNSLLISRDDWELVLNNSSPYRRKVLNIKNSVYVPHKKTMIFVLPPQKELEVLVRFQPKKPGVSTAILFIRYNIYFLRITQTFCFKLFTFF